MRDLSESIYKATVIDGDEKHVIFYRRPDQKEIAAYQASLFERKGNKIIPKAAEARTKFGARIITGFEKGSFGYAGKAFASDPADPDYREDWKKLLVDKVPDIIGAVGRFAFEATSVIGGEIEGLELAGEEDLDLEDPQMPEDSASSSK